MAAAFTRRYCEDNAEGHLQFTFYCDLCRRAYTAPAVKTPSEQGPFRKWKLQKAYRAAFDEAQENAKGHFNRCVQCKRWVCDQDFRPDCSLCAECNSDNGKGG